MTSYPSLSIALGSEDPEVRRRAISELGSVGAEDVDALMRALGDEDWRVRKEAVMVAVSGPPVAELLTALSDALRPGQNVGLRNAAVDALAGLGQDAILQLSGALPHLDADGRKLAVDALAKTGRAEALVLLRSLVSDLDANVRIAAIEATASVGVTCADKAISVLDECLRRDEVMERLAALVGLNRLGAQLDWESLEPLLEDAALTEPVWLALGRSGETKAVARLVSALRETTGARRNVVVTALHELLSAASDNLWLVGRTALSGLPEGTVAELTQLMQASEPLPLRRAALTVLGAVEDAAATRALVDALLDDALYADAEDVLERQGPLARRELLTRLGADDPRERAIALEVLGRHASNAGADASLAVNSGLDDDDEGVRAAALSAAAVVGGPELLGRVAQYLTLEEAPGLRQAAEVALSQLVARFPERASECAQAGVPAAARAVLIAGSPLAVTGSRESDRRVLTELLSEDSAYVRRVALDSLAQLAAPDTADAVVFALTDEEPEVRLAAVRALGKLAQVGSSALALGRLLELAAADDDDVLRATALAALSGVKDPRVLPALRAATRGDDTPSVVAAVEALSRMTDPRRIDVLVEVLSHAVAEVAKAALRGLARERDPRAQAHLGACLDHEAWDVRRLAADLLAQSGDPRAMGLLRAKLGAETEPLVQEALSRALERLESSGGVRRTTPPPGAGRGR